MIAKPVIIGREYMVGYYKVPATNASDAICKWLRAMINRESQLKRMYS